MLSPNITVTSIGLLYGEPDNGSLYAECMRNYRNVPDGHIKCDKFATEYMTVMTNIRVEESVARVAQFAIGLAGLAFGTHLFRKALTAKTWGGSLAYGLGATGGIAMGSLCVAMAVFATKTYIFPSP